MLKGSQVEVTIKGTLWDENVDFLFITTHAEPMSHHLTAISKMELRQGHGTIKNVTPIGPGDDVLTSNGLHGTVISVDGPDAFVFIPAQPSRGPSRDFTRFREHRAVHQIATLRRRNSDA